MGLKEGAVRGGVRNVSTGVSAIPDSGVLRYEFEDDGDPTVAVDSWNNNSASVNGATYSTDSKYGSFALDLDGSGDSIDSPYNPEGLTGYSFSAWIKPDTITSNAPAHGGIGGGNPILAMRINNNDVFNIVLGGGDESYFYVDSDTDTNEFAASGTISTGNYQMITGTWNGSTMRLYVDDTEVGSASCGGTLETGPLDIHDIGANTSSSKWYDGRIDDVRQYNRGLSSTEVSNLFNNGSI